MISNSKRFDAFMKTQRLVNSKRMRLRMMGTKHYSHIFRPKHPRLSTGVLTPATSTSTSMVSLISLRRFHISDKESKCSETLRISKSSCTKDLDPKRLPGTCKLGLNHPKYEGRIARTLASSVCANPGCGKSVLALKALFDQY